LKHGKEEGKSIHERKALNLRKGPPDHYKEKGCKGRVRKLTNFEGGRIQKKGFKKKDVGKPFGGGGAKAA